MTAASPPPLAADLTEGLKRLKMAALRQIAPELLVTAKTQRWSPEEFLRTLVEAEITVRDESNARTRLKAAGFPVTKTLNGFDVTGSSIPAGTFDYLASLEWIRATENIRCSANPRTSATWHRVAPRLIEQGLTVICPDLPGYGRSGKPEPTPDHAAHSKRSGTHHLLNAMTELGHEKFAVVGHDRGSYYALRMALDHPERVTRAALLDCLPISEHLDRADARFATAWWHWFFFAQPDIPERVINADPDSWYHGDPDAMGEENFAEWLNAIHDPDVVRGMLEDYRAGLGIDADHERADRAAGRQLSQPLFVL